MNDEHTLLARIDERVGGIIERLDKQNGNVAKLQGQVNNHETRLAVDEDNIEDLRKRPSATRAIIVFGAIISFLLGLFTYVSARGQTVIDVNTLTFRDDIKTSTVEIAEQTFKVKAWDAEMSIGLSSELTPLSVTGRSVTTVNLKDRVLISAEECSHDIYAINDGALEWSIIYKEHPGKNVFTYPIETNGLEFWYQPHEVVPDSPEVIAAFMEQFGEYIPPYRPDSVKGSYAVYHATKYNNHIRADGTEENYGTGKAFHIYRPKAWDSKADTVWCEIKVDVKAGTLVLTVPQVFLDKAKYPVTIDPTFGYTGVGASNVTISNSYCAANVDDVQTYTASTGDNITNFHWYGKQYSASRNIDMAIYSMPGGTIDGGSRLAAAATIVVTATEEQWTVIDVDQDLVNAVKYAVVHGRPSGTIVGKYDAAGTDSRYTGYTLPDTWTEASTQTRRYSFYATYTEAGGDEVIPSRRRKLLIGEIR